MTTLDVLPSAIAILDSSRVMAEQQLAQERARYVDEAERSGSGAQGVHYI